MSEEQFKRIEHATNLAIDRILAKGTDDVFKPPTFSHSIEAMILAQHPDEFRKIARNETIAFLKNANLSKKSIGPILRGLVTKDENSFRQCAWMDPFDAVKYLALAYLLFKQIEAARIPKDKQIVHSHRMSSSDDEIFDTNFGYDSFRARSAELSREYIGQWKVVTDISNFFDRIGNHSLENHLLNIGCEKNYVTLLKEMLLFWAGDRRSYGIPVGSDASRIFSESVLLNVDEKLEDKRIKWIRYVDDFRIFAETRADALKAVEILTDLLLDEGLSLNSKKTEIRKIVDPEEIIQITNRFAGGEHEPINIEEKVEVLHSVRASGRSSISRFYREPGKDAVKNIQKINKEKLIKDIVESTNEEIEQNIKLAMKYFIYADPDVRLIRVLIDKKITSVYYIVDALSKEVRNFSPDKCEEIKSALYEAIDWHKCPYPLQIPILRIAGLTAFSDPTFVRKIVDKHLQTDNMLFYREVISLGAPCLDRPRLRNLAMQTFPNVCPSVRRAIYYVVKEHLSLSEDEKQPLLKNMRFHTEDWFIKMI